MFNKSLIILFMCFFVGLTGPVYAQSNQEVMIPGKGPNDGLKFVPNADYDGDGISNKDENESGTFILEKDTDFDSLSDSDEQLLYITDPANADTDEDGLSDGVEVNDFFSDPKDPDENRNGVKDGEETRTVPIPPNPYHVSGTVTGKGNITRKFTIATNPFIMLQHIDQLDNLMYIHSFDNDLSFELDIPGDHKQKKWFTYKPNSGKLTPVIKAVQKENKWHVKVQGGGVILSINEETQQSKIEGLPNLLLPESIKHTNGKYKNKKTVTFKDKKDQDNMAVYEITPTNELRPLSVETGKTPVIMLHGLFGSTGSFGYENLWANSDDLAKANANVSSTQSFSGKSYSSGTQLSYGNKDVHFITSTSDYNELGAMLDSAQGYTPNVDLFAFEYDEGGHVGLGAQYLGQFIQDLRSSGIIPSSSPVQLLAHSKGGLVSRYYIENQNGSVNIARLFTIGTPHFGSDLSLYGDMDRDDSDLWKSNDHDPYCDTFTNSHPYTKYFLLGGFNPSDVPSSLIGYKQAPHLTGITSHYDDHVRSTFKAAGKTLSWWSYADIEDGAVNIDSAMGSDQDPDYNGTLQKLSVTKRFYLFHSTYGDHSAMRKHPETDNRTSQIFAGSWD
ncbi:hypothetical protein KUV80_09550 [Fictibacillus nanhaiensis]|uniref:esterase/lipase family protein n=1 Tax=Fictibacillus nanhaiensis TaxID=742169 RepID=UPI001C94D349|nr:hypothetical protein [Fictibacillus nanhaiensis]MBY6036899.1 hypothetical protein [Fictibacillus nanhaiensis]